MAPRFSQVSAPCRRSWSAQFNALLQAPAAPRSLVEPIVVSTPSARSHQSMFAGRERSMNYALRWMPSLHATLSSERSIPRRQGFMHDTMRAGANTAIGCDSRMSHQSSTRAMSGGDAVTSITMLPDARALSSSAPTRSARSQATGGVRRLLQRRCGEPYATAHGIASIVGMQDDTPSRSNSELPRVASCHRWCGTWSLASWRLQRGDSRSRGLVNS